jgi:hypothetical protein
MRRFRRYQRRNLRCNLCYGRRMFTDSPTRHVRGEYILARVAVPMRSCTRASVRTILACALVVWTALGSAVHAAPNWVARGTNLPQAAWAFDPGLGFGYADYGRGSLFGAGLNLEAAVGVLPELEIGLRTGLRLGNDGHTLRADEYGRLFERQTFGTDHDSVANPELRLRGRLVHGSIVELALEGRAYLPIEDNSRFGMMLGLPLLLHLGRVRIDSGLYLPILFRDRTEVVVSVPVDLWIQATARFWIGPMSGIRVYNPADVTDVSLGVGVGYQFTPAVDFKSMVVFPGINHRQGARNVGFGVGLQLRIE